MSKPKHTEAVSLCIISLSAHDLRNRCLLCSCKILLWILFNVDIFEKIRIRVPHLLFTKIMCYSRGPNPRAVDQYQNMAC